MSTCLERLTHAVDRERLIETALRLCRTYSPTGSAGEVADSLAELLADEGFSVARPDGGHPAAPAVVVRYDSGRPGRTLQFDGHLDTVHLPFVPPMREADRLTGTGTSDMKAGVAAAVEALRIVRETECLRGGGILFTAHDLHEAPWGDGSQLNHLIDAGFVGDAVLIPEYLHKVVPVAGRGQAILKIRIARSGKPVHEVYRPTDEPSVIAVGAELIRRMNEWDQRLRERSNPHAGGESVFIGQIHSGEIYNQFPQECHIEGTRRWLPDQSADRVKAEFHELLTKLADESGAQVDGEFLLVRDAFHLDIEDPVVEAFQGAVRAVTGAPLPFGGKPFVDDGNTFWARAKVAAITHGPEGGGAHTLNEWVSIDELVRVAVTYAATACAYCGID